MAIFNSVSESWKIFISWINKYTDRHLIYNIIPYTYNDAIILTADTSYRLLWVSFELIIRKGDRKTLSSMIEFADKLLKSQKRHQYWFPKNFPSVSVIVLEGFSWVRQNRQKLIKNVRFVNNVVRGYWYKNLLGLA